jgi:AcrR family transcriptional regulator
LQLDQELSLLSRKDQIIEAVIHKIQEEGFSTDITMTEIAKNVDIGKSTIYEYFKNKDEVLKNALLKMSENSIDRIFNIENIETMSFEDAFKAQIIVMYQIASESRMMFEVFSNDFKSQLPQAIQAELVCKIHEVKDLLEQRFIMIMLKGVKEGIIVLNQDPLSVNVISGLVVGSMLRYADADSNLDLHLFVDKVFEAVVKLGN